VKTAQYSGFNPGGHLPLSFHDFGIYLFLGVFSLQNAFSDISPRKEKKKLQIASLDYESTFLN